MFAHGFEAFQLSQSFPIVWSVKGGQASYGILCLVFAHSLVRSSVSPTTVKELQYRYSYSMMSDGGALTRVAEGPNRFWCLKISLLPN